MTEERVRYGVQEYLDTEETTRPKELVFGRLRDAASPAPPHQHAVLRFAMVLLEHVEERSLGTVLVSAMDCVLDRERALVVQPDVVFISAAREDIITDRVWGAPDIAVEVLSPNPKIGTLDERLGWFAQYGVRECWLYHQFARRLEVIRFDGGAVAERRLFEYRERISSSVLPEFDLTCASILTSYWRSRS